MLNDPLSFPVPIFIPSCMLPICDCSYINIAIMLVKSKQNSKTSKSPLLKTHKSGELPSTRHLVSFSHRNEEFYSVKQINHRMESSNEQPAGRLPARKGENFATTDESSNVHDSHLQESFFFADSKRGNEVAGRDKTESTWNTKLRRGEKEGGSRVGYLQAKLRQMRQLVVAH
jgi:hypothetical protein